MRFVVVKAVALSQISQPPVWHCDVNKERQMQGVSSLREWWALEASGFRSVEHLVGLRQIAREGRLANHVLAAANAARAISAWVWGGVEIETRSTPGSAIASSSDVRAMGIFAQSARALVFTGSRPIYALTSKPAARSAATWLLTPKLAPRTIAPKFSFDDIGSSIRAVRGMRPRGQQDIRLPAPISPGSGG